MSSYKRGYVVELRAKDKLYELGAEVVVRSSRSLTPIDLIAFFPRKKEIWLVQVKARELPKDLARLRKRFTDLINLSGTYTVHPILYVKVKGRYQFVEL
ncbi:MAG: hypothetical protein DRN91_07130 [Candidatus Alkanophagales archaeon]|nr:MAG: hypothetical protein DRN91_07130 [Candidatus Alkanophagales archaeon]